MRRSFDQMQREKMGRPVKLSIVFHICVFAVVAVLVYVSGFFHGEEWGQGTLNSSIQATLVSSAPAVPLPRTEAPNKNVLATQTPSKAPAIPQQKTEAVPMPNSVPIKSKPHPKMQVEHQKVPKRAKPKQLQHRANYGEQRSANMPHSSQASKMPAKTVTVNHGGSFASRFGWYVQLINQKVSNNWFEQEVDPSTPEGTKVVITFRISSGGGVSNVRITQPSGSPTLNSSARRAIQRVGSFSPLPSGYKGSYIEVEYTFTYSRTSQ